VVVEIVFHPHNIIIILHNVVIITRHANP